MILLFVLIAIFVAMVFIADAPNRTLRRTSGAASVRNVKPKGGDPA
jgi:hypothetical protein